MSQRRRVLLFWLIVPVLLAILAAAAFLKVSGNRAAGVPKLEMLAVLTLLAAAFARFWFPTSKSTRGATAN